VEGLTFDTGALIALERRSLRMDRVWHAALVSGRTITVPTAVVGEWWRGQKGAVTRVLDSVTIEPLTLEIAKIAGEALAGLRKGPSLVDAIVMASAAQRGDVVYTGDIDDLSSLQDRFPSVRLLRV
jgi:predicted nucleic acid-binding protein